MPDVLFGAALTGPRVLQRHPPRAEVLGRLTNGRLVEALSTVWTTELGRRASVRSSGRQPLKRPFQFRPGSAGDEAPRLVPLSICVDVRKRTSVMQVRTAAPFLCCAARIGPRLAPGIHRARPNPVPKSRSRRSDFKSPAACVERGGRHRTLTLRTISAQGGCGRAFVAWA